MLADYGYDMVGPHDVIMASCGVSGAALSDKISFIEDGVAQEVKRQVDIEAAAMTIQSGCMMASSIITVDL